MVVAVAIEVLFKDLIDAFSLAVTFQMITGSEVELHVKVFSETTEEMRDGFGASIRVTWNRTPCLEKTYIMKRSASWTAVRVLWVGMKIPCFDKRSTITRMES